VGEGWREVRSACTAEHKQLPVGVWGLIGRMWAWQAVLVNASSVLGQPSGISQPPRLLALIKN